MWNLKDWTKTLGVTPKVGQRWMWDAPGQKYIIEITKATDAQVVGRVVSVVDSFVFTIGTRISPINSTRWYILPGQEKPI
jgi:ABC-type antimicrobial peptide transport system permease subunit